MAPPCPPQPPEMNGDHQAIWNFLVHLNGRIDKLYVTAYVGFTAVVAALLSITVTLLTKG